MVALGLRGENESTSPGFRSRFEIFAFLVPALRHIDRLRACRERGGLH